MPGNSMAPKRMNREEFFAKTADLTQEQLRKALWTLYWRGTAKIRERIEEELEAPAAGPRKRAAPEPPDPDEVLDDVTEFAELARSGAYIAGDRRVKPSERTKWRVTFRRLANDALAALRAEDSGPAEEAVAELIDLACETKGYNYFRSEDPMEAAQFVVSDAAAALWETVRERHGFARFAALAGSQLPRWEEAFGWSRSGWGKLADKETTLAEVLQRMLRAPDAWATFAECYLDGLDQLAAADARKAAGMRHYSNEYVRRGRARDLAGWHQLLLAYLPGSDAEACLDRLVKHPALEGPELTFVAAQLAHLRGQDDRARKLAEQCLSDQPGNTEFADFAVEIGAELPPSARQRLAAGPPPESMGGAS